MVNVKPTDTETATGRERNNSSGTIGWAPRASATRNAITASVATPSAARTDGAPKPSAPPSIRPYVSAPMPTIAEHCPTQSKGAGRDGERPTFVSRYSATSPTGKLMKKIMRQLSNVRKPPTTGPADEATAAPSDQIAIARARCLALA